MTASTVCGVRSIELRTSDLEGSRAFYEDRWGLALVARDGDRLFLRATGAEPYVLALRRGSDAAPGTLTFAARDRAAVEALHERVSHARATGVTACGVLDAPGAGYGFSFVDPDGRRVAITGDATTREPAGERADVPVKISHVVMRGADPVATTAFYTDVLGFRVRDRTKTLTFLGCNADHHSIAFAQGETALHHVAFELPTIDAVMRGAGRLKRDGVTLEWGVGRHGPGNNVFAYFYDPNGFVVEYTTEMQQVDDATYRVGTALDWDRPTNADQWGVAGPPSSRFLTHSPPR